MTIGPTDAVFIGKRKDWREFAREEFVERERESGDCIAITVGEFYGVRSPFGGRRCGRYRARRNVLRLVGI